MLKGLREKAARNERLFFIVVSFVLIAVIFVNSNTLRSFLVGIFAFGFYLVLNGKMFGRVFFGEEDSLFRLVFGLFLFICVMTLMGILVLLVSELGVWYLLGMSSATIVAFLFSYIFGFNGPDKRQIEEKEFFFKGWYIIPVYGSYAVLMVLSFFLLFNARSGWIRGPIWNVIPSMFLQIYFIATVILGAIVLLPGKVAFKLLCVVVHSIFSLSFLVIVLYPGILYYDPWYTLSKSQESIMSLYARLFRQTFSVRTLNNFLKGRIEYVLIAAFAEVLCIDRYWSTVLLVPMMWGFFIPLTFYKITKKIGGSKGSSFLAALLTIPNLYFLAWGQLPTAASLGILFFLPFIYFLLRFLSSDEPLSVRWIFSSRGAKTYFPAVVTLASLVALHFLPMVLAITFAILGIPLKKYKHDKASFSINLLLFTAFILSIFILPFATVGRGILIPQLGVSAFSVEKLPDTSIWTLVFGVSEELPVQDAILYHIFPILGLTGFIYALQRKKIFNKTLCLFLFLAFWVCLIDYRILEYAVVGERIFGPGRLKTFRDILALPLASVAIMTSVKSLFYSTSEVRTRFKWRNILAGILVCVSLSAWMTIAVYETYAFYTKGLLPTSLEIEAVKYIDGHTNGTYVVLTHHSTAVIGHGLLGYPNFEKMYYSMGRLGAPSGPSVAGMFELMEMTEADVGYFMASFRMSNFDETIAEASRIFGLFKILGDENGQIYIFNYKIPPLPVSPEVMVFYWDAPSAYYVQNDLLRIIINPTTGTIEVGDFWGDLYERVDLDKALVNGHPVGNLTSIEYYDFQNVKWIEWNPAAEIPSAGQFEFRLVFEENSLIGLLESGEPFVDLWWESGLESTLSLEVGDFTRLYIPHLIAGKGSYDTNSREYGLFYTTVRGNNVVLQPAYGSNVSSPALTYGQIWEYGGFNLTKSHVFYDLYVLNNADTDQWVYIEVWLPDEVYTGTFPPFYYSVDSGETWTYPRYDVESESDTPVRTIGGAEVNWIVSIPRNPKDVPTRWGSYAEASGGGPILPENFTDSGGAQNRMFFGLYLPAGDKALLRLGSAIYYVRPLKVSYVFTDSDDVYYGLNNMENGLIKFYNLKESSYVGGLRSTQIPLSLTITQDEDNKMNSLSVTLPSDTTFSLLSGKEIDTTIDQDEDGIPDLIGEGR